MAALKIENLITESAMDGVNVSYAGAISDYLDLWTAAVRPKSSAGRGSNSKLELTGIKKLRELILELAVRGKLVPQDPSDEPASVLLERITAEKAQLVKEGKIKMPKALPEIGEEEKQFELPKGWAWCRLNDIINISSGDGLTSKQMAVDGDIPVFGGNGITGYHDKYNVSQPTLVIGRVGFYCGSVHITPQKAWVTDNAFVTKFSYLNIDINFLFLLLKATDLNENDNATAQPVISGRKLYPIVVCLPPLSEQHSIVTKVDELMALCDQLEQCSESQLAAHQTLVEALLATLTDSTDADELAQNWARLSTHFDTLFTTEASIDALKQTILQLAVMGKLVPQDPSDEPASALLERIAAEKAQLVKEKKIKKEKPLPAISEDEKPFELPQGWEWCHLKDIITIMDAGWSPACPPESSPDIDTWGVLKTTAVQTLEYREYENKVLDKTKTPRPEYEVMVGDILITRAGPKNRVGISCLVEKTRPKLMISDKIIRFHLVEVGLSERFISLCLNAGATAVYIDDSKSGMAESQMNISQDKLKLAPIPLGPIKEQNHIMDRVDQLMTLCDQLKSRLQTSQQTQLALAESLVEGALA
ncbi:restriction endonuclease subunit S [Shewanella sp. LZH-2]|jgi:type I restriction enzyme S subunit|uniref:restriction endonuclease subunit S n=1 Tax=Shewanella TaxID=22 RepID=UPI00193CA7D8|nr:restriction endonuclease subunit S [Shewanella sp. LZH-2]QRK78433.1 restriction endonuclease subunit S [Shewanella sp. LZH-2]